MFGRTVYFIGKPSVPVIAEDYEPLEFKASALDVIM